MFTESNFDVLKLHYSTMRSNIFFYFYKNGNAVRNSKSLKCSFYLICPVDRFKKSVGSYLKKKMLLYNPYEKCESNFKRCSFPIQIASKTDGNGKAFMPFKVSI